MAAISNDPSGEKYAKETFEINHLARFNNAKLAKSNGLRKYIIPSSCSNYGKIRDDEIADETFKTNPLANYSAANIKAENELEENSMEYQLILKSDPTSRISVFLGVANSFLISLSSCFITVNNFDFELRIPR